MNLSTIFQSVRKVAKDGQRQLKSDRSIILFNGLFLGLLIALGFYIRMSGTAPGSGYSNRIETLEGLFSEPFDPKEPYLGMLTSLSEVLWCFSATICIVTFSLIKRFHSARKTDWFILCSAIGIGVLLVDDLFRLTLILHSFAGVPKPFMYSIYGMAAIAYFVAFWRRLLSTPYVLLLISIILFIISGVTDVLPIEGNGTPIFLEDGTKLLGILNVALYFWQVCHQQVAGFFNGKIRAESDLKV